MVTTSTTHGKHRLDLPEGLKLGGPMRTIVDILGVRILDLTAAEAISVMDEWIRDPHRSTHRLYIANAHTLNLAWEDPAYRRILNSADAVFGDGTGVRWAARLQGTRIQDNLVGTDLIVNFFKATANRGYRYYLLGNEERGIERAAACADRLFSGWVQAGFHHGYLDAKDSRAVVDQINRAKPDLLLVGMGNPLQEQWLHDYGAFLQVPLCVGVGGLFDYWAGNMRRTPLWLRRLGMEWFGLLLKQPHKFPRYVLGNPKFLFRAMKQARARRLRRRVP